MAIDRARRPGSGRAACVGLEAPSRLGTAQHGSPRGQSYGRLSSPGSLSPRRQSKAPISLRVALQVFHVQPLTCVAQVPWPLYLRSMMVVTLALTLTLTRTRTRDPNPNP